MTERAPISSQHTQLFGFGIATAGESKTVIGKIRVFEGEEVSRIEDHVKAEVVAYAGKEYADRAAHNRRVGFEAINSLAASKPESISHVTEGGIEAMAKEDNFLFEYASSCVDAAAEAEIAAKKVYKNTEALYDGLVSTKSKDLEKIIAARGEQ